MTTISIQNYQTKEAGNDFTMNLLYTTKRYHVFEQISHLFGTTRKVKVLSSTFPK